MSETINQTARKRSNGETALGYVILIMMAVVVISGCGHGDDDESRGPEIGPSINPISWMTDQINVIGSRTLREISIPGSHDAGMNGKTHCWAGSDCNTQTQLKTIYEQLSAGSRFFDIRPARWGSDSDDTWYAGHFQHTGVGWLGCTGESLDSILHNVRTFCSDIGPKSKELIILNFSHCYVVHESGGAGGRDCNGDEWKNDVLAKAKSYLSDYLVDWNRYKNPVEAIFSDRGPGEHVLLRFETDHVSTDRSSGVYNSHDFPIYNNYADTEDVDKMVDDQFEKLFDHSLGTNRMFLLSYTLTLTPHDAVVCPLHKDISIKELAEKAKKQLPSTIQSKINDGTITQGNFPNIIYVDLFDTFATEQSVMLNSKYADLPPWWEYINNNFTRPGVFRTAKSLLGDADYSVFTGAMNEKLLGFDSMGSQFFSKSVQYGLWAIIFPPVLWGQYVYATDGFHCISRFLLKDGTGSDYRVCPPMPKAKLPETATFIGAPAIASDGKVFVTGVEIWDTDEWLEPIPGAWLFGYTNDDAMELIFNKHVEDCVYLSPPLVDYTGRVYVATSPQPKGEYRCKTSHHATLYGYDTEGNVIIKVYLHGVPDVPLGGMSPLAIGWSPSKDDSAIFVTGSGYLMAYDTDTGDPHFPPIRAGSELTGAVYSPIDDRVYVGAKHSHLLLGYTFQGEKVFEVDIGEEMSELVYVEWDTTPPAYCICMNTTHFMTKCYRSDGLKIYDQHIQGAYIAGFPPAIPYGGSSWDATKVYVTAGGKGDIDVLARQGTLHHPGIVK